MKRFKDGYDDKFDDVMQYVEMRLDERGKRVKVRDKEDLRRSLILLETERKDSKNSPRMSKEFIQKILNTRSAQEKIGKTLGKFGSLTTFRRQEGTTLEPTGEDAKLAKELRQQGKDVYRYDGGYAVKKIITRDGKRVFGFADVRTGKFIQKKRLRED